MHAALDTASRFCINTNHSHFYAYWRMTQSAPPSQASQPAPQPSAVPAQPALDSSQLLGGRKQVAISHGGELYSLRLTRNGKLILTK